MLIAGWERGDSAAAIAEAIGGGITMRSVLSRTYKLGLTRRHNPFEAVWTEEQEAALRDGWARGDSTRTISGAVGMSRNAIIGKARRMGLDRRPSPIIRRAAE